MLRVLSKTRDNQPSVIPDGIYGNDTMRAVSAFQRQEGLPITGVADSGTWRVIVDAFTAESPLVLPAAPLEIIWQPRDKIYPGERSLHLFLIQAMLVAIGEVYADVPRLQVTGIHDERSVEAVLWLQKKCGLPTTGSINQVDWLFLTKLYRMTAGDGKKIYGERLNR